LPTLMAVILGMLVAKVVESLVSPYVGVSVRAAISLLVFVAVAYPARRQLMRWRAGG
jgi:hypothetical protein